MLSLEECLALKEKFRKEYPDNTLIIKVDTYPDVAVIVNHTDNKSWGYFYGKGGSHLYIGVSNKRIGYSYSQWGEYSMKKKKLVCIHDKEYVRKAYNEWYLKYTKEFSYYINNSYVFTEFIINPELFARCFDAGIQLDAYSIHITGIDYSKASIKEVFGMPLSYVKLYFDDGCYYFLLKEGYKKGFSVEEIRNSYVFKTYRFRPEYITRPIVKYASQIGNPCLYMYIDYLSFLSALPDEERKQFPVTPKDLEKYHDRAYKLYLHIEEQRRYKTQKEKNAQYLEKYYPEANKFTFKDDQFSIFPCNDLNQLIVEGNCLSHCVGTYFNSVSEGREYILFLRRNNDIDTPFFTVDVTPDLVVRQIHGFRNCNITDEIRPFIEKWAKTYNLNITHTSGCLTSLC